MQAMPRRPQQQSFGAPFAISFHMSTNSRNASHDPPQNDCSETGGGVRRGFRRFANCTAAAVGSAWAFVAAVLIIIVWAISGPMFHFSDTWQLVINTGTTIITFLMVFLIQNTQNRDARAMHLKLDELIRGVRGARTGLVDLEELSDEELDRLQREFQRLRKMPESQQSENAIEEIVEEVADEKKDRGRHKAGSAN